MDEFVARIEELELAIEEGYTRVLLQSARWIAEVLELEFVFNGHEWGKSDQVLNEHWCIRAYDVVEHQLQLGDVEPALESVHPRLDHLREDQLALMFASSPFNIPQLEYDLRGVHDTAHYGPFTVSTNWSFGIGQAIQGPSSLMERYAAVLEAHQMRPSFFKAFRRDAPLTMPAHIRMLNLTWDRTWSTQNFVIAAEFTAHRLPTNTSDSPNSG